MHFKCAMCEHEFCSGCYNPFLNNHGQVLSYILRSSTFKINQVDQTFFLIILILMDITTEISLSPMNVFYLLNCECVFVISKGCVY